jgi:hypothetical protein
MFSKSVTVFFSLLLTAKIVNANEAFPLSKSEMFKLGQTMAECASFFKVIALLPPAKDNPNTVQLAENKAGGWRMASMFFLLGGSSGDSQLHVTETADALIELKKTEFLSRLETRGAQGLAEMSNEFDAKCMPLVPIQERTVQALRSGN